MRQHLARASRRLTVLVAADLASFFLMRALLRAIRDAEVLGPWYAGQVRDVLPRGLMNGWGYATALLVALLVTGNYGTGDDRRSPGRLLAAASLATALPLWNTIWTVGAGTVAVQFILVTLLVWLALVLERLTVDRLARPLAHPEAHASATVFVGMASECRRTMKNPVFATGGEYRSMGFVDLASPAADGALGRADEFARVLAETHAETVVICGFLPDHWYHEIVDLALATGCHVMSVPRAVDLAWCQPLVVWKQGQAFIELNAPAVRAQALVIKRIADSTVAAVGLILLAPLFLAVAFLIKLDSPGPIFFASERWGKGGRRIRIWKFRTMVDGAVALLHQDEKLREEYSRDVKLTGDPRVTQIGRRLRRWSIDELPQLFNVLLGEMSLVGPRPKLFGEEKKYGMVFDAVLSVPPGLTGLWQVSGRNSLSYEERIALDLEYVRRCSLALDLRLLMQTGYAVVRGVGAH